MFEGRRVLVVFVRQDDERDTEHPITPVRPFPKHFPKSKSGPVPIIKSIEFNFKPLPTIESDPTPEVSACPSSFDSICDEHDDDRGALTRGSRDDDSDDERWMHEIIETDTDESIPESPITNGDVDTLNVISQRETTKVDERIKLTAVSGVFANN
ncbi:hypothetical protein BLNAU_13563 [Blattamonas nauphoetae]|uniref:Uncharacterized protein n=1 Tax=Blattamonas nauphoetae TaxID=2049346 RepID=A0ABQ9XHP6_9EUKA|nr:hypothetical protein BLNAU_13563 [Blattamonas nauphoetae]